MHSSSARDTTRTTHHLLQEVLAADCATLLHQVPYWLGNSCPKHEECWPSHECKVAVFAPKLTSRFRSQPRLKTTCKARPCQPWFNHLKHMTIRHIQAHLLLTSHLPSARTPPFLDSMPLKPSRPHSQHMYHSNQTANPNHLSAPTPYASSFTWRSFSAPGVGSKCMFGSASQRLPYVLHVQQCFHLQIC